MPDLVNCLKLFEDCLSGFSRSIDVFCTRLLLFLSFSGSPFPTQLLLAICPIHPSIPCFPFFLIPSNRYQLTPFLSTLNRFTDTDRTD